MTIGLALLALVYVLWLFVTWPLVEALLDELERFLDNPE